MSTKELERLSIIEKTIAKRLTQMIAGFVAVRLFMQFLRIYTLFTFIILLEFANRTPLKN